jgi:hypothetical protein
VTNSNSNWAIDSGATRHFSGYIQDFPSLKRWLVPKAVRLANGSIFEALGYGDINLITTKGPYTLKDVWYTPEFTCRLISTYILNSCGIKVMLKNIDYTPNIRVLLSLKGRASRDSVISISQLPWHSQPIRLLVEMSCLLLSRQGSYSTTD